MKSTRWKNRDVGRRRPWRCPWYAKSEMLVIVQMEMWEAAGQLVPEARRKLRLELEIWELHVASSSSLGRLDEAIRGECIEGDGEARECPGSAEPGKEALGRESRSSVSDTRRERSVEKRNWPHEERARAAVDSLDLAVGNPPGNRQVGRSAQ